MTIGLIINPKARKFHKSRQVRESLDRFSQFAETEFLEDFSTLPLIMFRLAQKKITHLAISGGDGTIQAILTQLAEENQIRPLPTLILLPHGTTNMTAKDAGIGSLRKADQLLAQMAKTGSAGLPGEIVQRHTIKIANPAGGAPLHGMYFGWGAVHRAVIKCQSDVHAIGLRGDLGPALTLLGSWASHLFGRSGKDSDRIVQGQNLHLVADGNTRCKSNQLLLSVTTLEHLIANCRPFWNQTEDTLKTTLIAYPVQKTLRMLLPVLYGEKHRSITEPGYDSFSADRLSFQTTSDCILDGEIVSPPENEPLRLSLGTQFRFLKV